MNPENEVLRLDGVSKVFFQRASLRASNVIKAVTNASLSLRRGEVVALVGESGSGKSTLGRAAIRITEPSQGKIWLEGRQITHLDRRKLKPLRRKMQMIFQDPYGSLNPKIRIGEAVGEGMRLHGIASSRDVGQRVAAAIERVGLPAELAKRWPSALSGGQRQRIAIARALAVEPSIIVADEPTSALDVSVQAEIMDLLKDLQRREHLSMLFISHDLRIVRELSDRVLVLYLGHVVEAGPVNQVFSSPAHPYTEALLQSVPRHPAEPAKKRLVLEGELPNPISPPQGCVFHPRCRYALPACKQADMSSRTVAPGHLTACIRDDLDLNATAVERR
ncbi:ABC transporter ATP-binding protein [Pseudohoeflea coraliihabitans]|uniref:ATP-binding cassette domain-containing protein n=1 Tax=Pseudohoeflea coraliihabitans TaxID=2860393 RepID=A0ABS6WKP7_9HYPH|nr:oligopeptide/dipeptide ABC transporter ATP-binding protein [Pseudohoeflea sp. DP4N28-3]MBW3096012.1 ATP-binding cassette domain-containing protein [Pseudohoeflea sp. DP4N28-3]